MANTIKVKRSSVAGKVPTTGDLELGEIAVNTYDGKMYMEKNNGTASVVQIGDVVGAASATDNALVRFDGTTGKLIQNGTITQDDDGNLLNVNSVGFDITPGGTLPTAAGSMYWDAADGNQTLNLVMAGGNVTQQIGEEQYYRIKASSAITNGQAVMFTGTVGGSGALTGAPASGLTDATSTYFMGIATENIALNGWGYVTNFGLVRGINTTGGAESWVDGQILYYNPAVAGGLTKTVPAAPAAKIQVAVVVNAASGGSGSLFVRSTINVSLEDLNDVETASASTNDLLQYDGSKWLHKAPSTVTGLGGLANALTIGTGLGGTSYNGTSAVTITNTGVTSITGTASQITASASTGGVTLSLPSTINVNTSGNAATATSATTATNLAGGAANKVPYQTGSGATAFIDAPTTANQVLSYNGSALVWAVGAGSGTVTSVAMTVPTGLSIAGSPITTSGTLALTFAAGYSIPTTSSQTNWDTAYTDRLKWDGGSTGLVASTGRTSLGATTLGSNLFTITNPGAVTFPRFNADNTVSSLNAADFRTAIGAGTGSGTVTSVGITAGTGIAVSGSPVTSSGNMTVSLATIASAIYYDNFTATASQTTFATSASYTSGKIEVFKNGTKMRNGTDVTVTSGNQIVFAVACTVNDLVDAVYPGTANAASFVYDTFTATASQTTFATSQAYTSMKISVYRNGAKMRNGSDVTVTSGTSVVFATACTAGDLIDVNYPT